MNRCLSNKTLYLLYTGDETAAQQLHLNQCSTCAKRYKQLAQRLTTVEQMLQQSPPPFFEAKQWKPQPVYRWRFSFAAAMLVVVLAFTGSVLLRKESPQVRSPQIPNQEVSRFFEDEVSSALFATTDISESSIPTPVPDTAYLEAALTDSWPCEQRDASSVVECDIHPLPLPNERY